MLFHKPRTILARVQLLVALAGLLLAPLLHAERLPPPTPVQDAHSGKPGMPDAGDRWLYRGFDVDRPANKFEVAVEAVGAAETEVIEIVRAVGGQATRWVYGPPPVLVGGSTAFVMFSPYLGAFESLSVGQSWNNVRVENLKPCGLPIQGFVVGCRAFARIVAKEKVAVEAGAFEAFKIVVHVMFQSGVPQHAGSRELTYWYSEEARRIVKYTNLSIGGITSGTDPNVNFELVAYRFEGRAPVGKMASAPAGELQSADAAVVIVASAAPVGTVYAAGGPAVPKPGDRWEYEIRDLSANRSTKTIVEISEAGARGIQEQIGPESGTHTWVAHSAGAYLSGAGMLQFSPYLLAFAEIAVGQDLGEVSAVQVADCLGGSECWLSAHVSGNERVTVPAGSFDAVRVVVNLRMRNDLAVQASGEFTYWYSQQARRIVKASGRTYGNTALTPDFEIALISYRLQ